MVAQNSESKERVFLTTDRNVYVAGEFIYFQFHYVHSDSFTESSQFGYIILRSSGNLIVEKIPFKLINGKAHGSIYLPDTLQTGIYQLVGFTNRMRNYQGISSNSREIMIANRFDSELSLLLTGQMLLNHQEVNNLSDSSLTEPLPAKSKQIIEIETGKNNYGTRSRVDFEVLLKDSNDIYDLSVSVAPVQSIMGFDYSLADFGYSGNDILIGDDRNLSGAHFLPEKKSFVLAGRVSNSVTNTGLENIVVLLSTPDTVLNLQYSTTLKDGIFYFQLNPYYYARDVFLTLYPSQLNADNKIEIYDKYLFKEPFRTTVLRIDPNLREYLTESQKIIKVQKVFQQNYNYLESKRTIMGFAPLLYSKPVSIIYLDDYYPLNDFREISRELITQLRIRQNRSEYAFNLVNHTSRIFFNEPPLLFVNSLLVLKPEKVIPLGSDALYKVETHNLQWVYGDLDFSGIIGLFTNNLEPAYFQREGHIAYYVEEPIPPSTYISPERTQRIEFRDDEPDFRQLLFWMPDQILSPDCRELNFSFYTGDLKGDYIIKIEAISSAGEKIVSTKPFKVE